MPRVIFFMLLLQVATLARAFGPARTVISTKKVVSISQRQIKSTTPTMVVYWSIKSAFDLGKYALGGSDKFKGTGVWSFIEFDKNGDKAEVPDETTASKTKASSKRATDDKESS